MGCRKNSMQISAAITEKIPRHITCPIIPVAHTEYGC